MQVGSPCGLGFCRDGQRAGVARSGVTWHNSDAAGRACAYLRRGHSDYGRHHMTGRKVANGWRKRRALTLTLATAMVAGTVGLMGSGASGADVTAIKGEAW